MGKTDRRRVLLVPSLLAACVVGVAGCSGGGSNAPGPAPAPTPVPPPPPPPSAASIQVLPASFDFGKVTTNNSSAPLQVTISNTGTTALTVSGITLSAPSGPPYALAVGGGAKPCGSATPTVAAADSCTVQVLFAPTTSGTFTSTLQITSNATNTPTVSLPISGTSEQVQSLTVRINQLDNVCPGNAGTAYVSVTDQGGFTVLGLLAANFMITQGATLPNPTTVTYVDQVNKPIAMAAVMDNSGSLTKQPVAFADMKTGFSNLIGAMKATDVAQVMKFATDYEITQPFTSNKTLLQTAINAPFNKGELTLLYDTVYKAVDDTALQTAFRRAVIVATDGIDEGPTVGVPLSTHTLPQVIANAQAKNVAIFTIGIGSSVNATALGQMASSTGGIFYQASASQNLATIYQQLSSLLFERQYVVTFTVAGAPASPTPVTIAATSGGVSGNGTKSATTCGP